MNIIKSIVLLLTIITTKSILFSQTSSTDSVKCFTYDQVKIITAEIKKAEICDSIQKNQSLQIFNFKEIVLKDKEIITLHEEKIIDQNKSIRKLDLKLKLAKNISLVGIPAAFVLGFIIAK
jgi:hypothetical protein